MFTDLHLHTTFSDGTYSPEELASEAKRFGLIAVALTDHDTVEGCPRMKAACEAAAIEFIPATELTAEINGIELHMLAYFVDIESAVLLERMHHFQDERHERIREIVARLQKMKVPLEEEDVFALANCRSPGRPHVARALIQRKICSSLDEAFERFLKKNRPAWVPKEKISAADALKLIHSAGGLAVVAHPGLARTEEALPALIEAGIDGIECYHSRHSPAASNYYTSLAEQHDLLVTGGSDCHGMNKGKPLIGSIKLPYEYVRQIKERLPEDHPARKTTAPIDRPPL
ncbi:MAG TPA: PHP domain-containing protein [Verrucomicrobiae bacterium]|nr:PHP domain-containing protein [Verrucomicrobiae bacterium]